MVDEEEDPDKEGKVNGMEDAVIDEEVVASGSKEGEELSEQVRKMKVWDLICSDTKSGFILTLFSFSAQTDLYGRPR